MSSGPTFLDRVQAVSTTTGTGPYTLGSAVPGFQSFAGVGDGNSCYYCAQEVDGSGVPSGGWEVGLGTYTASGTSLSRDAVLSSSNTGAAVSWAAGTRRVLLIVPAMIFSGLAPRVETAITGATTLTASAWGHAYVCSGAADYTVGLPSAVGHAGERLFLRMAPTLTALVTLAGDGSETLDDAGTRILWASESCELMSDGTNLVKVGGRSIPMTAVFSQVTQQDGILDATWTPIVLDTLVSGTAFLWDPTNGRATIPRPGAFGIATVVGLASYQQLQYVQAVATLNGTITTTPTGLARMDFTVGVIPWAGSYLAAAGDYIDLQGWAQTNGADARTCATQGNGDDINGWPPSFAVTELAPW